MVATEAEDEFQRTVAVRFCVLLSVNIPVAVNGSWVPWGTEAEAGAIAMEASAAGVTLSDVDPLIEPSVALIVAEPCAPAIAKPLLPCALLTVAFDEEEEAQITWAVKF